MQKKIYIRDITQSLDRVSYLDNHVILLYYRKQKNSKS